MKKNLYKISILLSGLFFLAACKKDNYNRYNQADLLQFGPDPAFLYRNDYQLRDTLTRTTFYYEDAEVIRDTVYFNLYTVGNISDQDRPFRLEQEILPDTENAVAGRHYVAFNDPSVQQLYVIKGGEHHYRMPVILLRDPSLKETEVTLKFKVVENEYFKEGTRTNIWRKVIYTDKLSKPAGWDLQAYYFGVYSLKRHEFMIRVTGKPWNDEFFEEIRGIYSVIDYWRVALRKAVIDYNKEHPNDPLRDEFGLITF